jgi:potassium voltage-gated channel Eag-related subfamily H protein 7
MNARTTEFTTLLKISREDFLTIINESPDDNERFTYIRDNLLLYDKYNEIGLACESCGSFDHDIMLCPLIHYCANKELVILLFLFI